MQFTESNSYVLRLLEALAGQGPALALLRGQGWGGVYNAIDPTEIKILIRCYLYSAKLPRTRTGRARHSKFDCTENKDVLFRERIIKEPRLWGGWVGVQTFRRPLLLSWLPHFSPFSIAKYLASLGNCPLFPLLPTLLELPPPNLYASASHTPPAPIVPGTFPLSIKHNWHQISPCKNSALQNKAGT